METLFKLVNYHWKWFGPLSVLILVLFLIKQVKRLFGER